MPALFAQTCLSENLGSLGYVQFSRLLSTSNSKAQYRNYEKKDTRRKALCFPILDNCMTPEDFEIK